MGRDDRLSSMHPVLNYDLILFDFDGLLVNTEELHYQAYMDLLAELGAPMKWSFPEFAAIAHTSSTGLREAIEPYVADWPAFYQAKKEHYMELLEEGELELMPGALQMLELVREKKHAVATNSTRAQIERIRKALPELESIPLWVTREDYKQAKPAPDAYLTAMEKLGGGSAIGFEDSLRGLQSLQAAKVEPILICPPDHPQLKSNQLSFYPSFTEYLNI